MPSAAVALERLRLLRSTPPNPAARPPVGCVVYGLRGGRGLPVEPPWGAAVKHQGGQPGRTAGLPRRVAEHEFGPAVAQDVFDRGPRELEVDRDCSEAGPYS